MGTRDKPAALGSTIKGEDCTAVVNSYTAEGNATVATEQFNEAAPAGSHYAVINYTVTYTGDESGYAGEMIVDIVTGAGNVVNSYDNIVLLSDSIGGGELFTGATTTGSQAFVVPDGESALTRVQPGILADEVFVQPLPRNHPEAPGQSQGPLLCPATEREGDAVLQGLKSTVCAT